MWRLKVRNYVAHSGVLHRRIRIQTRIPCILDSYYGPFKARIAVYAVEDMCEETADVGRRYMGAFCDFEGVEGDEVDGIDVVAFQGRKISRRSGGLIKDPYDMRGAREGKGSLAGCWFGQKPGGVDTWFIY